MTVRRVIGSEWRIDGEDVSLRGVFDDAARFGPQLVHVAGATYEVRVVPRKPAKSAKDALSAGGPLADGDIERSTDR